MTFTLGEIRQVGIEVMNQLSVDFVIESAEYQIVDRAGTEAERGFPTIEEHKITTLFNANQKGLFYVIFKYHIGPEILKAKILVEVI